jgi:hypothetical protein
MVSFDTLVPFDTFWSRLTAQLSQLQTLRPGVHVATIRKWSQLQGYFGGEFGLAYHGGNVLTCERVTTNSVRTDVHATHFRKVYEVWPKYRAGSVTRSYIVHDLGAQKSAWIIPILHEYEALMA